MSKQTKPSIVFVHGLWADGSCFGKLIPTLQAEGHEVIAAQYGLDALASDVAAAKSALGRVNSPAILVGHSYGGTLITAAGADPRVAGTRLHRRTRTGCRRNIAESAGQVSRHGRFFAYRSRGRAYLAETRRYRVSLRETSPSRSRSSSGLHRECRFPDLFTQKVEGTAWRSKPSWFIVAKKDRTVHPELQRFVAKRMGATVVRGRQQSRPDAVSARPRSRRNPQGCERRSKGLIPARRPLLERANV